MLAPLAIALFLAVLPISNAPGANDPPAAVVPDAPKSPPPAAARWLARVNAGEAGAFPPPRSFTASYRVNWGSVEAARVESRFTAPENNDGDTRLAVRANTTGLARTLYTLDATHLSVVNARTLHPVRVEQQEEASGKRATSRVDFLPGEAVRTASFTSSKKGRETPKPRCYPYPGLYDMNSALLYMRSLPMNTGDERTMALMTATGPYLATIKVVGRGRVRVGAGEFPAIECSLALEKINKNGELEPRKGFKSAHAWLSDDANRLLVKAEAQVFIGSVSLELEKVSFGGAPGR